MLGFIEMAGVGLVYSALTFLTFIRLWPHLQTHSITRNIWDFGPNLWLQWWGPYALSRAMNPFHTRWLFYPAGSELTVDAWPVQWLIEWPLRIFLNPVGRYNLLAAFSYFATGLASYALFRLFTRSKSGALLASFALTFSSYRNFSLVTSHSELLQTQWAVLMVLAYFVYQRGPWPRKTNLWLLAAAAAAAYNELRTFMMAMMLIGVYSIFSAWLRHREAPEDAERFLWKWLTFCLGVAVITAPLFIEDVRVLGLGRYRTAPHIATMSVGWRDALLPPAHHLLRVFDNNALGSDMLEERGEGYVSVAVLGLAILGLIRLRDRAEERPLALALAFFAVLEATHRPLARLPFLSFLRVPARFSFVTALLAGIFACQGWEYLSGRIRDVPSRFLLWAALSVMIVVETNPVLEPLTVVWNADETALDALKKRGDGAVLDLPLTLEPPFSLIPPLSFAGRYNVEAFLRAVRHEKPLVNGNLSFPGMGDSGDRCDKDLQSLLLCQGRGSCGGLDGSFWSRLRQSEGIRYVISEKTAPENPLLAAARRSGALSVVETDPEIDVYEIRAPLPGSDD
ncbi:MAG: hypothetical protein ACHQ2Z_00325 [Elusimicrobiota bacterium]